MMCGWQLMARGPSSNLQMATRNTTAMMMMADV
jgi:hypothetical protein